MMNMEELVSAIAELNGEDLRAWMREALVTPDSDDGTPVFSEKECARIRLICTLHYEMDVDADTLAMVMSLIDQLHQSRENLRKLSSAVMAQNEAVRSAIMTALRDM